MNMRRLGIAGVVWAGAVAAGCRSTPSAEPLTPGSFYGNQPVNADPVDHPLDKPGPIQYDPPRTDPQSARPPLILAPQKAEPVTPTVTAQRPSSNNGAPATADSQEGGFQVVGFVVAEVNGNPIFADEVIKQLRSALAAEARKLDRESFRQLASQLVERQIDVLVMNELEIAAASNQLKDEEKKTADTLTMQWRAQEITRAGGSIQQARENYRQQGLDFEEEVRKRYQFHLLQVFTWRKLMPLVRVSADDMRDYYRRNVDVYTLHGQATFRVIKIDPKQHGGRDAAERRARELRAQALAGDFEKLASSDANDDAIGRANGGLLKDLKKDSYVNEKVEAAVWAAKPGEVTDVVADGGAFYVAKVESLEAGTVQPFQDMAVQAGIRDRLTKEQYQKLRSEYQRKLIANSVKKGPTKSQVAITIDMAMQNYDQWAAAE